MDCVLPKVVGICSEGKPGKKTYLASRSKRKRVETNRSAAVLAAQYPAACDAASKDLRHLFPASFNQNSQSP